MAEYEINDCISREKVLETIRYMVCQGRGNKERMCHHGSCAYCGIMEIMCEISCIESVKIDIKDGDK